MQTQDDFRVEISDSPTEIKQIGVGGGLTPLLIRDWLTAYWFSAIRKRGETFTNLRGFKIRQWSATKRHITRVEK